MVKTLREQSGFGWDEGRQIVTAPDDVWDKYITVNLFFVVLVDIDMVFRSTLLQNRTARNLSRYSTTSHHSSIKSLQQVWGLTI